MKASAKTPSAQTWGAGNAYISSIIRRRIIPAGIPQSEVEKAPRGFPSALRIVLVHRAHPDFLASALRALHGLTASECALTICDLGPPADAGKVRYLASFFPGATTVRPKDDASALRGHFEGAGQIAVVESVSPPTAYGWDESLRDGAVLPGIRLVGADEAGKDLQAVLPVPRNRRTFLARLDAELDLALLAAARRPGSPLEDVACDLCGARDARTVLRAYDILNRLPGFWNVVQCRTCGLAYTNPRPRPDRILTYYPDSYGCYQPYTPEAPPNDKSLKAVIKRWRGRFRKQLMRQHFGYYSGELGRSDLWKALTWPLRGTERMKLIPRFPERTVSPKLLEIGCGNGSALSRMRAMGWEVTGLEPSQAASELARNDGLDVRTTGVDDADFGRGRFDCILMNMVLEHLPSPSLSLKRILEWLRPGGELLFSVPDATGWEARWHGRYHYGLQVPTHLYHFTPATLRLLLPGFPLEILHQHVHRDLKAGLEYRLEYADNSVLRIMARLPRKFFTLTAFILSLAGKTSRMSVRTVKPSPSQG